MGIEKLAVIPEVVIGDPVNAVKAGDSRFRGNDAQATSEITSDDETMLLAAFRALIPGAMLFVPMLFARFANDGTPPAVELQIDYFRTMFADNNERTRLIGEQRAIPEEVWKEGVHADIERAIEKLGRIAERTRIMRKARRERALK